ncbi:hypothetical protein [Micromonospora sp. CPCC 206061]|uniref:hypothetical protein n=1 Tax=Micromonospora sp. CPCC 206061 TaxID=3122410 RepID=UPI002FF122A4
MHTPLPADPGRVSASQKAIAPLRPDVERALVESYLHAPQAERRRCRSEDFCKHDATQLKARIGD